MKTLLRTLWLIVVISAAILAWWFLAGPWQNAGNSLVSHDAVRFGPIPGYLTIAWCAVLFITILMARFTRPRKASGTRKWPSQQGH
jgi:hypothetical protein